MGWAEAFPTGLSPGNTWPCFGALSLGHFGWDNAILRGDSLATYCAPFYLLKWIQWKSLSRYNWQLLQGWIQFRDSCHLLPTACFITWLLLLGFKCSYVCLWEEPLQWPDADSSGKTQGQPVLPPAFLPTRPAVGQGCRMRPLLGRRVCVIQALAVPLVTHLLPPMLQRGQTRTYYRTYWNKVKICSPKKSIQSPRLTTWADFINLSLLFSPCWLLAYFPVCSCLGSGTRLKRCSGCHGEKLEFALYLFNLFLNGSVLQYVKSAWLASTPDTTNLGLYLSIACLLKSTVKSSASFAADSISFLWLDFPGDSCLKALKQN